MKGLLNPETFDQKLIPVIYDAFSFPTLGSFICIITLIISFFLSDASSAKSKKSPQRSTHENVTPLFPSIIQTSGNLNLGLSHEPEDLACKPQPCSTGLTTRLLPFKNEKGEIEWVFTEDNQAESNLDAFKLNPDVPRAPKKEESTGPLSPITSNSSNNESLNDHKSPSAQTSTPSSTFSEDRSKEDDAGDECEMHQCPHCDAKFRLRGYLTRHLKKHSSEKAYKCPFHKSSIYKDDKDHVHQCHPSGAFSRRDTYKTHLKTRHFRYPDGTGIKDRPSSEGKCSMCGDWFENAEIWSEIHIEGHECRYLPEGFKGKSRIKNRLKKQMHRMMKLKKKQDRESACGDPSAVDLDSPALSTPNSINTPALSTSLHENDESPQSISPATVSNLPVSAEEQSRHPHNFVLIDTPGSAFASQGHNFSRKFNMEEDYGDEFCLDTEQMGFSDAFHGTFGPAHGHNIRPFYGYQNVAQPYMSQYIH